MVIAQWNLSKNGDVSGLARYDNEIYKNCSSLIDIKRCRSTGNPFRSLYGYKTGNVTHITTHQIGFLNILPNIKNSIVTIHDLIPHIWFSPARKVKELQIFNEFFLKYTDHFICISEYTKSDLIKHFNIPESKISVVYNGVDHGFYYPRNKDESKIKLGLDPDKDYLLAVSSDEPWKNTKILDSIKGDFEIIKIGYGSGKFGLVKESLMPYLYSSASAFLAPSLHEGFGLPVLEAMACGTPVIAANKTALPEVVSYGGQIVDPYNIPDWIQAIDNVLDAPNLWENKAILRATDFSWEKCGKETVDVYERFLC